jgi:hypothetical protein
VSTVEQFGSEADGEGPVTDWQGPFCSNAVTLPALDHPATLTGKVLQPGLVQVQDMEIDLDALVPKPSDVVARAGNTIAIRRHLSLRGDAVVALSDLDVQAEGVELVPTRVDVRDLASDDQLVITNNTYTTRNGTSFVRDGTDQIALVPSTVLEPGDQQTLDVEILTPFPRGTLLPISDAMPVVAHLIPRLDPADIAFGRFDRPRSTRMAGLSIRAAHATASRSRPATLPPVTARRLVDYESSWRLTDARRPVSPCETPSGSRSHPS